MLKKSMECVRWAFNFRKWEPSQSDWMFAARCIQKEEKERIGRFVFVDDAKAAMAGRLLIRKFVSEHLGVPYSDIELKRTERGKPYLVNEVAKKMDFNISHHGEYTVLAADVGSGVGVDVMRIERRSGRSLLEFFRLMKRQFSDQEWSYINQCQTETEKLNMFYRLWCLKESYLKADGSGLSYDLQSVSFTLPTLKVSHGEVVIDSTLKVKNEDVDLWCYEESLLDDQHVVTVAVDKNVFQDREHSLFVKLMFSDVVQNAVPISDADDDYYRDFCSKLKRD